MTLNSKTVQYRYTTQYTPVSAAYTALDTLTMFMAGDYEGQFVPPATPVYACDWKYRVHGDNDGKWYYAVNNDQACDLGGNDTTFSMWVDLKAPLATGNSWTFVNSDNHETVTATVQSIGSAARINGVVYSDVAQVNYAGAFTHGTKWFAKGVGIVYSKITDESATIEQQLLTVTK